MISSYFKISPLIMALSLTTLSGCNDSSDSTPTASSRSLSGILIDAPVHNISYVSKSSEGVESFSGETDSEGKYKYNKGDTVTFSIGQVEFPPTKANGVVTPLDLAKTNDTQDDEVVNMIRLLQSLDQDNNPDNGITITDDAKNAAVNTIDFSIDKISFENDDNVLSLIAGGGQDDLVTELITESEALAHFEEQLVDQGITFGKFVGTWLIDTPNENELLMFTFFDDGTYVHAEVDLDPHTADNPDEISGMEWGQYTVNDLNEFSSSNNYFDENGDTGVTGVITSSQVENTNGDVAVFSFSENNRLAFNVTSYEGGSAIETNVLEFIKLADNNIVGTWLVEGDNENELLMLAFLDNGTYVHAEVDLDPENADNPSEDNGMEWGNYVLNSQTNELTISFDNRTLTDFNGRTGLSDFADNPNTQLYATVSGDTLSIRVVEGDEESTFTFDRQ